MSAAVFLARLLLAAVFLVSGVSKLRDLAGSRQAVRDFGLPAALTAPIGTLLPFVELALVALLVTGDEPAVVGAAAALALLLAFTAAIVANLARGNHPPCRCFGALSAEPLGWSSVVRNTALIGLALLVALAGRDHGTWDDAGDWSATGWWVGGAIVALTFLVAALAWVCWQLFTRYGATLLRLDALEAAAAGGGPVLPMAPEFDLPVMGTDRRESLTSLRRGGPALLFFTSARCAPCAALAPEMGAWAGLLDLPVAVLATGSADEAAEKFGTNPALTLLADSRTWRDYKVDGTPAAAYVDAAGRLAAGPVGGREEITKLVQQLGVDLQAARIGLPAPTLTLPGPGGVDGDPARHYDEVVLLFWDDNCGFCRRMEDDLLAWDAEHPDSPLVVVSRSGDAQLRAKGLRAPVYTDAHANAEKAYSAPGTPSAAHVVNGRLTQALSVGGPAVLELLDHSVQPARV
jgi:thiol-disulfide isomerase/thioredoxin/uncharacterized membrane protein YphA (DoxX/SURF4 family)